MDSTTTTMALAAKRISPTSSKPCKKSAFSATRALPNPAAEAVPFPISRSALDMLNAFNHPNLGEDGFNGMLQPNLPGYPQHHAWFTQRGNLGQVLF